MSREKHGYASDMSDKEWELIQTLLPLERKGPGRPLEVDMREVVNAIFYVVRGGIPWEYLPHEYLNYKQCVLPLSQVVPGWALAAHQHGVSPAGAPTTGSQARTHCCGH